ncbi:uncharacterized protein si:ch211-132g1.1 [Seriola aureovittata]|uniref:uncharacterized protein si:ch211-132g1.1 n=1 Tax=Seriola aureovittata TaxID=2871759 RepID=UPI0024BE56AA|nr:uncharacterized protein si:ch211-132g1.1 [Seriola aureovittata]XP_056226000.1 uncharacterized protein si:ch211-132g1.1 [Seriola aureovittata]XP_056226001.1 uncharacterized protein si:ch211-132g1.1 [Seriola aureovittata]
MLESGSSSFLLNMARMKMKMAAVSKITLLLLCSSIITSTDSKDDCNSYATTGGNFTVLLNHKLTNQEKLRWKQDTTVIFNQGPSKSGISVTTGSKNDIHPNGSLRLTNLKKNQEGTYYPEVYTAEGKAVQNLKKTILCVYDPVPTPHLTAKCQKSKVEYTCTVGSKQDGLIFEWLQNDKPLEKKTTKTLLLDLKQAQKGSVKCKVSNKASNTTSNATEQPCKTGGFVLPDKIWGYSVWIFVGSGGGIVLVLIITTIVCCLWAKRRKSLQLKDEEELRLGWTNTQQPHQHDRHQHNHPPDHPHHHHHHQQQQPAGHTGPRQHRTKQQRPRAPEPTNGQPQPTPRRAAQTPRPVVNDDDEQPPPLPQPRKKAPKTPRM